ncbi:aspartate dehydrogenase [Ancylobacter pratisalsi]|uniref:L-aspartate dehydrogenase n=1 Tax=Ancylobacter pratisalsi TaxID=1745854 RepID=A0A6P1YLJ3_9HYPH|nr:aspartate dehydrogenase [Ancylobacter pratisalsi]QIB33952.1 aspartate dehydrogenase [Ancylobacter pratisalsi]
MAGTAGVASHLRHVGLIGFGAIGRDLHGQLRADFDLTVLTRSRDRAGPKDGRHVHSIEALIAAGPDLVVEAAAQAAAIELVPALLEAGIDVVIGSTGALGDGAAAERLLAAAEAGVARLIVPAGAVGGLDYLAAISSLADARVTYTSRKPVAAWAGELAAAGIDGSRLAGAHVLFEGTAREAARLYPRNVNAGLTVALAAGHGRTRVRVVADPSVTHNTHQITVESAAGSALMCFTNLPSPSNPKTSTLTALSLAAAVRRHFATLVI